MRPIPLLLCAALLSACGGGDDDDGCFAAGTPIATPRGDVAIEDLRPGDQVLSMAPATGAVATAIVTHVRRHPGRRFRILELKDGARLGVTDDHPIYDRRRAAFVPAAQISAEARLARWVGEGRGDVYDLTVTGEHTYFAAGLLVHNKTLDAGAPRDAHACAAVAACMAWSGGRPGGLHGYLFDGCDTPDCCVEPSDWWAAGTFAAEPEPGATATPLETALPDARGAFELAAGPGANVLCAGAPLVGGDLRVTGSCVELTASTGRIDFASDPDGGAWLACGN